MSIENNNPIKKQPRTVLEVLQAALQVFYVLPDSIVWVKPDNSSDFIEVTDQESLEEGKNNHEYRAVAKELTVTWVENPAADHVLMEEALEKLRDTDCPVFFRLPGSKMPDPGIKAPDRVTPNEMTCAQVTKLLTTLFAYLSGFTLEVVKKTSDPSKARYVVVHFDDHNYVYKVKEYEQGLNTLRSADIQIEFTEIRGAG